MTQDEADKELGRIVRESLTKIINRPAACETDVVVDVASHGMVLARIRVEHAGRLINIFIISVDNVAGMFHCPTRDHNSRRSNIMYLFFDTETSGLPDKKQSASWEGQPHICQLGVIVADPNGRVKAEVNLLVRPEGWTIPAETSAIHGITQEDAEKYGLSIKGVLSIFGRLLTRSEMIVAHNLTFDLLMLEIEVERTAVELDLPKKPFCTMEKARNVLKIPPTAKMAACVMKDYKRPNLQETYRHFFGRDFEGAHDAMADVRACKDVFFALKQLEATKASGAAA